MEPLSSALESLNILLENGELNIFSFWNHFRSKWTKHKDEKRTKVLNTFIKCLAHLPHFEPTNQESAEYAYFVSNRDEIIIWLFSMAEKEDLTKSTLTVLSRYQLNYFTSKGFQIFELIQNRKKFTPGCQRY